MSRIIRRSIALGLVAGVVATLLPALLFSWSTTSVLGRELVPTASAEVVAPPSGAPDTAPPGVDQNTRRAGSATSVDAFTMIGVALAHPSHAPVYVRVQGENGWGAWQAMSFDEADGPDTNSVEGRNQKAVTDGIWVGKATGYEINVADGSGAVTALLIRDERQAHLVSVPTATAGADPIEPPFAYNNRASWGARPSVNAPSYSSQLKLGVVHHSATNAGSSYSAADMPGILRSIQAYHMDGRGWNDIAYNVVVDRFGGIWEGRGGGIDRDVIGSHALGFNTDTVGVMMIGDYGSDGPTNAAVTSVARVLGWRMFLDGVDPSTPNVQYTSGGSLTIAAGVVATLPRIVGHRDVGATDCPGSNLYSRIADIRSQAKTYYDQLVANSTPFGHVDAISGAAGSVSVAGWVIDPDAYQGTGRVLVSLPDRSTTVVANVDRVDLAPFGYGTLHGFTADLVGVPAGTRQVCVTYLNPGPGTDVDAGCSPVTVTPPSVGGSPVGQITAATPTVGGFRLTGFALDADQPGGISVSITAAGRTSTVTANQPVVGLGGTYPGQGDNHGFSLDLSGLTGGPVSVCATALNVGGGSSSPLGCTTVTLPGGSPIGILDAAAVSGTTVSASGWSIDPDSPAPVWTVMQVDGASAVAMMANLDRPDIAAAFPGQGAAHGFALTADLVLSPGDHSVCAYADGVGLGSGRQLSCKTVTVPGAVAPAPAPAPRAIGGMDPVNVGRRQVGLTGFAFDTSTPDRVLVWIVLDGRWILTWADQHKPFFSFFFPGYGEEHGFGVTVPAGKGNHNMCAASLTANLKSLVLLRCQSFTMP